MKFGYADPPYFGQGKKLYGKHHEDAAVYDTIEGHQALIDRLVDEFPDGWAMSVSSPSLRTLLPMCPEDVRVMAWVKPFCAFKPNVNPAYAWEPVIVRGGRKRGRDIPTARDWVSENITLKKGLTGAKPVKFCFWIIEVLGMILEDELVDLFPGTGIMHETLSAWRLSEHARIAEGREPVLISRAA